MTISNSDAARSLGSMRSQKKADSSRRNLAAARAKVAKALAAYKDAQYGEEKSATLHALKKAIGAPVLLVPGKETR